MIYAHICNWDEEKSYDIKDEMRETYRIHNLDVWNYICNVAAMAELDTGLSKEEVWERMDERDVIGMIVDDPKLAMSYDFDFWAAIVA